MTRNEKIADLIDQRKAWLQLQAATNNLISALEDILNADAEKAAESLKELAAEAAEALAELASKSSIDEAFQSAQQSRGGTH